MTEVIAICAIATNGVIGRDNKLPWRMADDLAHFRRITKTHAVVMGRLTCESLGKPLELRTNLVLSAGGSRLPHGFVGVPTVVSALVAASSHEKLFVIGGPRVWDAFRPYLTGVYLTRVHATPQGDTSFHSFDEWYRWPFRRTDKIKANSRNEHGATVYHIERYGRCDPVRCT